MYIESTNLFSDDQALTATAVSTNVIDLSIDRNIGMGEPVAVVVSVSVAADFTTTDETYQFQLETDDNDSFSSATVIADQTVAAADLAVGDKVVLFIGHANEQYLRMNYVLGGTTPSVTVSTFLIPAEMVDGYTNYASGYTIT